MDVLLESRNPVRSESRGWCGSLVTKILGISEHALVKCSVANVVLDSHLQEKEAERQHHARHHHFSHSDSATDLGQPLLGEG